MTELESYAVVRARLVSRLRGERVDGSVQTTAEKLEEKQRALDHYLTQGDAARWELYGEELQLTVRNLLTVIGRRDIDRPCPEADKAVALLQRIR